MYILGYVRLIKGITILSIYSLRNSIKNYYHVGIFLMVVIVEKNNGTNRIRIRFLIHHFSYLFWNLNCIAILHRFYGSGGRGTRTRSSELLRLKMLR